nr:nitroreductase family protein [Euryarchaeota archaeon]
MTTRKDGIESSREASADVSNSPASVDVSNSLDVADSNFVPHVFHEISAAEMEERATEFLNLSASRRTTRNFSNREVPRSLIEKAIMTGGTAPSGAHLQPWTFVAISNPELKSKIRAAAEDEEEKFYSERIPEEWAEVLAPL